MRPKVTIESREAIDELYDFYENHQQSQIFAKLGHAVLGTLYRPYVTYEDGAKEDIAEATENNVRLNLVSNHLTADDQNVFVAIAQRERVLRSLIGHTFIPAKQSISSQPWWKGGTILRRAVDGLGAIPIWRMEDLRRLGLDNDPDALANYEYAMKRAHETQRARMTRGVRNHGRPTRYPIASPSPLPYDNEASFPESTRNLTDHTKVQDLKNGVFFLLCEVAEDVDAAVVPMAMYFGGEPTDYRKADVPAKFTPDVRIGRLIPVRTSDPKELAALVKPAMQACLDVAVASSEERQYRSS